MITDSILNDKTKLDLKEYINSFSLDQKDDRTIEFLSGRLSSYEIERIMAS